MSGLFKSPRFFYNICHPSRLLVTNFIEMIDNLITILQTSHFIFGTNNEQDIVGKPRGYAR